MTEKILIDGTEGVYSKRLVITKLDFYNTVMAAVRMTDPKMLAAGKYLGLPSAHEEEAIYGKVNQDAKKLRDVDELRDYFVNDSEDWYGEEWYGCGWTTTGLRFREADLRKPYNVGDKITVQVIETDITPFLSQIADPMFTHIDLKDVIDKANHVKGEIAIPYCMGNVITEMHPVFGIFTEVDSATEHKTPFALHGCLGRSNLNLIQQDPISGHYDLAVAYNRSVLSHRECLHVDATETRSFVGFFGSFRPVVRDST